MSTIAERYDRAAARYLTWWAPVLAPAALGVLDLVAPFVDGSPQRLLDVGTGTGTLAIAALERWPALRATGLDGSTGMLEVAEKEARRRLGASADRFARVSAPADRMPFADASFDLAISSFVYQLVPHRPRAFREAWRVLRPGGRLAFVSWLVVDAPFAPDEAFEATLDELDIDEPEDDEEARSGDFRSPAAAAAQVRRAGFGDVSAWTEWLEHRYDPATYVDFLEQYAERGLFESLDSETVERLRAATARRLARLGPADFVWRMPVVSLLARRR